MSDARRFIPYSTNIRTSLWSDRAPFSRLSCSRCLFVLPSSTVLSLIISRHSRGIACTSDMAVKNCAMEGAAEGGVHRA
jgi:hypothetical protein